VRESDLSKDGLFRAVTIREKSSSLLGHAEKPTELKQYFPSLSHSVLQMICSELVSKGLLHDKGVSYTDREAMELFVATDLAKWLMDWVREPEGEKKM